MAVVGRLARQVAAVRLDFLQAIAHRVVAVGAAPHQQLFEFAAQAISVS
jgi:hypothetical protein